MKKTVKTQAASALAIAPEAPETKAAPTLAIAKDEPEVTASKGASQVHKPSLMATVSEQGLSEAAQKSAIISNAKQRLAEAFDDLRDGEYRVKSAKELADEAGLILYQGLVTEVTRNGKVMPLVSMAEVSAALGDITGFVPKKDGSPGKTPAGEGGHIRKRIVRAAQAYAYAMGGDGGSFFNGLPVEEIADVVHWLDSGELSLWAAYDRFATIKKDHLEKKEAAFNPAAISKIADKLGEDVTASAQAWLANPELVAAYAALRDIMAIVDAEAATLA